MNRNELINIINQCKKPDENCLNLSGRNLTTLLPNVDEISILKGLDIRDSQLDTVPSGIGRCSNLQKIYIIKDNKLTVIPLKDEKSSLPRRYHRATKLKSGRNLTTQSQNIKELSFRKKLDIRDSHLDTLPWEIGSCSNLQKIYIIIKDNKLTVIHLKDAKSSLPRRYFRVNKLKTLPSKVTKLPLSRCYYGVSKFKTVLLNNIEFSKMNVLVYVSSTSNDLKEYRDAVIKALQKMEGIKLVCMEKNVAQDKLPVDKCLTDVSKCDIYFGVFARRYGFIPQVYDKSITELEYSKAGEASIPKLIFLAAKEGSLIGAKEPTDKFVPSDNLVLTLKENMLQPEPEEVKLVEEMRKLYPESIVDNSETEDEIKRMITDEVESTFAIIIRTYYPLKEPIVISRGDSFTQEVSLELVKYLKIDILKAHIVIRLLYNELYNFVAKNNCTRSWGNIVIENSIIKLIPNDNVYSYTPPSELDASYWETHNIEPSTETSQSNKIHAA
ncbi:MAG: DUF4062 domain-containing protein [Nitrospirae bacterium]|nr:DUF4062 domain-containing protein [Nitrospirota bacterium]